MTKPGIPRLTRRSDSNVPLLKKYCRLTCFSPYTTNEICPQQLTGTIDSLIERDQYCLRASLKSFHPTVLSL